MGDVHDHSQAIHLANHVLPEWGETSMPRRLGLDVEVERPVRVVVEVRAIVEQVAVDRVGDEELARVVEGERPEAVHRGRQQTGGEVRHVAVDAGQAGAETIGLRERVDRHVGGRRAEPDQIDDGS